MTDFSETPMSPVEDGPLYDDIHNITWISSNTRGGLRLDPNISTFIFYLSQFISIIGVLGNGIVIYLLGFHSKRSPFTMYILNLAVADFGVLLVFRLFFIFSLIKEAHIVFNMASAVMQNTSQLLLTAMGIDRCGSGFFPISHRCHRPPHLSTMVCALVWVLACLHLGSLVITYYYGELLPVTFFELSYAFLACDVLCLPLVTVSTTILLFKVFCKSQQPRRGRFLTTVFLMLLFFLIFAFPRNAIRIVWYFGIDIMDLLVCASLCACLNSCVNPMIYYMVGRKKRGQQRQSLKVILQRAFKEEEEEEEEHRQEQGTTAETSL